MRKLRYSILLALTLVFLFILPAAAGQQIQVFFNGKVLEFDVPPTVISDRTMVPLRAIFEAFDAKVTWDDTTKTANATWPDGELSLPVGRPVATLNGVAKNLDVSAVVINNRTLVPLRFVAETLGAVVGWYGQSKVITINIPPKPLVSVKVSRVIDGDTVEILFTNNKQENIRLIGVDTPETVHPTKEVQYYGIEASNFTKTQLADKNPLLEVDVEERDRYGRLLGYLYLPVGTMFNAVLIDEGYAQIATFPPNVRYVELFKALQTNARENKRGLWAIDNATTPILPAAGSVQSGKIKGNINSKGEKIYHVPGGSFYNATDAEEYFDTEDEAQGAGFRRSQR